MSYPARPAIERFEPKVAARATGCIEWIASTNKRGYGTFKGDGQTLAHRFSYQHFVGPIPDGLLVCHTCDNPPCVNPDHLFVGTHADNAADKSAKGRAVAPLANRETCINGHEMTEQNTRVSIQRDKYPHRTCKTCRAAQQRAYYKRKKTQNAA